MRALSLFLAVTLMGVVGLSTTKAQQQEQATTKDQQKNGTITARQAAAQRKDYMLQEAMDQRMKQFLEYTGTRLALQPRLDEETRKIHAQVASQIEALDPRPPDRLAYFSYILNNGGMRCNGWNGAIRRVTPSANGLLVEITVAPALAVLGRAHTGVMDHYNETYEVQAGGSIRYVKGEGTPGALKGIYHQ